MKLIILGLDALNAKLIEKHKEEMPTLYSHLKNDASGPLRTTVPYFTGPTWTSFQTGKTVGNHGIVNFLKYDEEFKLRIISSDDIKEKTFYEYADRNKIKCFVMNLPYTYPPKIEGDMIFSWLHIYDKVEDLFYPISLMDKYPSLKHYKNRADRSKSVIRYLKTGREVLLAQGNAVKEVISSEEHGLYFFLINAADMVQHKAFDELMSGKDNKKTRIGKNILKDLDQLVKWVDEHNKEGITLIASDHGFQVYDGKFLVNSWLKKEGYLKTSADGTQLKEVINRRQKKKGNIDISRMIIFIKKRPVLFRLLEPFYDFFVRYSPFDLIKQPGIDFLNTKAYCRSSFEGIIFFNEKLGDEERDNLKKELLEKLNKIEGIKAHDCDQFFKGKYKTQLGEIAVTSEKYEIDSTIGENEFLLLKRNMHSMNGIFMAYGKGIKNNYTVKGANIFDVMPTILHILNIPIPKDLDGKVLQDIFEENTELRTRKIIIQEMDKTEEEKEILAKTIQKLKLKI